LVVSTLTLQSTGWGRRRCTPLPPLPFCLLLKISLGNPYLKILYLANIFVADASMKKENENILVSPPLRALPKTARARKG